MDAFALNLSDSVIAVSSDVKGAMRREGVKEEKLFLLPNAIDLERLDGLQLENERLREELGVCGCVLVGSISHLIERKGINYLVEAASIVLSEIPNVKFLIVGEGEERERLEWLASSLGVRESFVFTGFRKDIPQLLSILDIVVIPSISEGLPIVALEAMAMRKPIVATEGIGVPPGGSIFVPKRNPEKLALGILDLLRDKEKAAELGGKGRKLVEEKFNIEERVDKVERIYQRLRSERCRK
jgi:glycosyltransferase involved in cell wall biosynthesis